MASTVDDIPDPLQERIASELADIREELEEISETDTALATRAENALDWLDDYGGDSDAA